MATTLLNAIPGTTAMYTAAQADAQFVTKRTTITGIDGTSTGTTNILTGAGGVTTFVTKVIVRLTAISGGAGNGRYPKLGFGIAAGEDDIIAPVKIQGVLVANQDIWEFNLEGKTINVPAASVMKLGIDNASNSTTYTISVDALYYEI